MGVKVWTGATDTDWNNVGNWDGGAIPINGDDVYIQNSSQSILLNLDQNALSLASLNILQSFSGQVGTMAESLKLDATNVFIGSTIDGKARGSVLTALEFVSSNTTIDIINAQNTGTDISANKIAGQNVLITGLGSGTIDVILRSGTIGILTDPSKTGTLNSLTGYSGKCVTGEGLTITTLDNIGSRIEAYFNIVTATLKSGILTLFDSANITTLNIEDEGQFISQGNGTITALNSDGGSAELLFIGLTVTTITGSAGGIIDLDLDLITVTNEIKVSSSSVILNMGF